jgi:uncharacterized protein YkwD
MISGTALVLAGIGVYIGVDSLAGSGSGAPDGGGGQYIENVGGPLVDELGVKVSSTSSPLGAERPIEGIGLSPPTAVPSPSDQATTAPETALALGERDDPATSAETTTPATDPPTSVEGTGTSGEPTSSTTVTSPGATQPPTSETAPSTPTTAAPAGLNAVELEIFRLTNELRADPSGALARDKPMPSCVGDDFYDITIDAATGHPGAVPALTLSEPVSLEMSRPWAVDMDQRNTMSHRPNDSQLAIYDQLGIGVSAIGENVAWFQGYPDSQAARIHFEGWRESDTGHYCALVSGTYTHIGVGHHRGAARSWAVQNFYRTR